MKRIYLVSSIVLILIVCGLSVFLIKQSNVELAEDLSLVNAEAIGGADDDLFLNENDVFLGHEEANVLVTVYDSFSCVHCAAFYHNVFPQIKKSYIAEDSVIFVHKDLPLDPVATDVAQAFRCYRGSFLKTEDGGFTEADSQKYYAAIEMFYKSQMSIISDKNYLVKLKDFFKIIGFSTDKFTECFKDESYVKYFDDEKKVAIEKLKLKGTPAVFVNGIPLDKISQKAMDEAIQNAIKVAKSSEKNNEVLD